MRFLSATLLAASFSLVSLPQYVRAEDHLTTTEDVHRYVRAAGITAAGTNALVDGALTQPAANGVSWLEVFKLLIAVDAVVNAIETKDYTGAVLQGEQHGASKILSASVGWSALSAAANIAKLAELPIEWALKNFERTVTNQTIVRQTHLYIEARKKQPREFFLAGKDDDQNGIYFADNGWLLVVDDEGGTSYRGWFPPPPYTKEQVFGLAEQVYQASLQVDRYKQQRATVLAEFQTVLASAQATAASPSSASRSEAPSSLTAYYAAMSAKDYTKAFALASELAKRDDPAGEYALGFMYFYGFGTGRNVAQALEWFRKSAEAGYAPGQRSYGVMIASGLSGSSGVKDFARAAEWYEKAAAQDDGVALHSLGALHQFGHGMPADENRAADLYRQAIGPVRHDAERGHPTAQTVLGSMYEAGEAVQQDVQQAVVWYRKAADQDYPPAQHILGSKYESGVGVPKDLAKAAALYRAVADRGIPEAQVALGNMYMNGVGQPQNDKKALTWFAKAAEQNNVWGERSLGYMYEAGRGVAKDLAKARMWYEKAAAQGDTYAADRLPALTARTSSGSGTTSSVGPSNCKILTAPPFNPYSSQSADMSMWSGSCINGLAEGTGTLIWYSRGIRFLTEDFTDANGVMMRAGRPTTSDAVIESAVSWKITICKKLGRIPKDYPMPGAFPADSRTIEGRVSDALDLANDAIANKLLLIAEQIVWKTCPAKGWDGKPNRSNVNVYLFQKGEQVVRARSYGNGFSDKHREYENSALKARADAAGKAWSDERMRRANAAAQTRAAAEGEQTRQRSIISRQRYDDFVSKSGIEVWPPNDELTANPFAYEGKIIGLWVWFDQMIDRDRGLFGEIVVSSIPSDVFRGKTQVLLAGRVLGNEAIDTPFGGKVLLPHLKFVDVYKCQEPKCEDALFWYRGSQ